MHYDYVQVNHLPELASEMFYLRTEGVRARESFTLEEKLDSPLLILNL
jgi:hypothetical protein